MPADLHDHPGFTLPGGSVRLEGLPWIAADLNEEVEAGLPGTEAVLTNLAAFLSQPGIQRRVFGRGLLPGTGPLATDSQPGDRLWTAGLTPGLSSALAGRSIAAPLAPSARAYMPRNWVDLVGSHDGEERCPLTR